MRQTILLADDSPTIQRLVAQTFADSSFDVVSVSNGEAAIRRLEETRPSVVLADIYMPGRSGYEVCSYVRSHAELGATPVILLVGAFDAFDEATATSAGSTASITKPFEPRALIDLVKSVIAEAASGASRASVQSEEAPVSAPSADNVEEAAAAPRSVPEPVLHELVIPDRPVDPPVEPPAVRPAASAKEASTAIPSPTEEDILGLAALFREPEVKSAPDLTDADLDRIAERVMRKVSAAAVESVAWDVVPEIAEKVLRESIKRTE